MGWWEWSLDVNSHIPTSKSAPAMCKRSTYIHWTAHGGSFCRPPCAYTLPHALMLVRSLSLPSPTRTAYVKQSPGRFVIVHAAHTHTMAGLRNHPHHTPCVCSFGSEQACCSMEASRLHFHSMPQCIFNKVRALPQPNFRVRFQRIPTPLSEHYPLTAFSRHPHNLTPFTETPQSLTTVPLTPFR